MLEQALISPLRPVPSLAALEPSLGGQALGKVLGGKMASDAERIVRF